MTRINRPDTLLTELRDIERRLRLLEASRMRPAAALSALAGPAPAPSGTPLASGVPLKPARPVDWPGTTSSSWERLAVTWPVGTGRAARLTVQLAADADTAGQARVLVDGATVGDPITAAGSPARAGVDIPADRLPEGVEVEVSVEARRTGGPGQIRVIASLL